MTDLSRFTPGEVIAVTDKWGDYTFEAPAVFLGVDRGLAVVAWPTGPVNNPFLIDHGERPYLRRATWEPRRIRKARVTGTYAEYEARLAAERAEKVQAQRDADDLEARKRAALRSLSEALDRFPGVSSYTYGSGGEVRIYGDPDGIEAAAAAIANLDVAGVAA